MDLGVDKSINDILERAEIERKDLISQIENVIYGKLPDALENNLNQIESFRRIAKKLDIMYEPNYDMQNFIKAYMSKLSSLKMELEDLDIKSETILEEASIENTQKVLELVDPALKEASNNFFISSERQISEAYDKKVEINDELMEAEKEKSNLEGKLSVTKRKKTRREIEEKIKDLDIKIDSLRADIDKLSYVETAEAAEKNDTENNDLNKAEEQVIEKNDDTTRNQQQGEQPEEANENR